MVSVTLQFLHHNNQDRLAIHFENNFRINNIIRPLKGLAWSKTHRCWHLPLSQANYYALKKLLKDVAEVNSAPLLDHFKQQPAVQKASAPPPQQNNTGPVEVKKVQVAAAKPGNPIHEVNQHVLPAVIQQIQLRALSRSTLKTYTSEIRQFLQLIGSKPADEFTTQRLKDYLQYCLVTLKLSENTLHSRINALKLYYEQVLHKEELFFEIPRPKKPEQLPKVFNQDEISGILNGVANKKHKAMLMLAYGAGMRVAEVVAIKTCHIDSKRMTILVKGAKGKKDRYVGLSAVLLVILRDYAAIYKPDPKGYLFAGATNGQPYSSRSLQQVLTNAKKRANVLRPGSMHSLRHSFATHLLEKGTDITMIQKLLGHNDLKTTLIYLHTTNKDLIKIISPLDDLKLT